MTTSPRSALVTGGAGFIGSHLTRRLLREGWKVAVVDNLSTGYRENVPAGASFTLVDLSRNDLIEGDATTWEREPMEALANSGQLAAWVHEGFWQPMDTLRDKQTLTRAWDSGKAPWKKWEN